MNISQTIIGMLRSALDRAHRAYLLRESEWAAAQAGHYHWEQNNPNDGVGSISMNPFDCDRAETIRGQAKQSWRELSAAHDYAVDQFINPRRFTVRVFDDNGETSRVYGVPASTRVDAQLIAFILDQGIEAAKYGGGCVIESGEVELAKMHTKVVE